MSYTTDLLTGLAEYLALEGAGVWEPSGTYDDFQATAITLAGTITSPDRVIALQAYPLTDDPTLSDSMIGLQVRCRGTEDPRDVDTIGDTVFDKLHGLWGADLNGVRLVQALRQSSVPFGRDDNGRWQRVDNYHLTVHYPSQQRT